jgi:hypothetical protein
LNAYTSAEAAFWSELIFATTLSILSDPARTPGPLSKLFGKLAGDLPSEQVSCASASLDIKVLPELVGSRSATPGSSSRWAWPTDLNEDDQPTTQPESTRGVYFDVAVRDPTDPSRIAPDFDSGDHLHFNLAGYQVMDNAPRSNHPEWSVISPPR